MNLNNTLFEISDFLNTHGEKFIFTKEPNENDTDIDLLITNRRNRNVVRLLYQKTALPIISTSTKRGFIFYLSKNGYIKPIDVYDAPFLYDETINFFAQRAVKSNFDSSFVTLEQSDQISFSIYKIFKKRKIRLSHFKKIILLKKFTGFDCALKSLKQILIFQKEEEKFVDDILLFIEMVYMDGISLKELQDYLGAQTLIDQKDRAKLLTKFKRFVEKLGSYCDFSSRSCGHYPVICFLGVDGSGKSTTISELAKSCEKLKFSQYRLETKSHLSTVNKYVISFFNQYLRRAALICILYETQFKIRYFFTQAKKSIVLVDRWWFDFYMAPKRSSLAHRYPSLFRSFLRLREPDLIIVLEVERGITALRRPNENIEELELKKANLKSFVQTSLSNKVLILQGDDELKINTKKIHKDVLCTWRQLRSHGQ